MNPVTSPSTSPEPPADAALLRQVVDHRPEALAALYDRHAPSLLALGKRILGSTADAEEV